MKRYFFILIPLFFSCVERRAEQAMSATAEVVSDTRSKLERFLDNSTDSVYQHVDLSGDSIRQMPDLSAYTIESLDLSNNQIDSVNLVIRYFPKKLRSINLSNNQISGWIIWGGLPYSQEYNFIDSVNLSNNSIEVFYCDSTLIQHLELQNNRLIGVYIKEDRTKFLNISNNPKLKGNFYFNPHKIDSVIRHNIADDKPLHWRGGDRYVRIGC